MCFMQDLALAPDGGRERDGWKTKAVVLPLVPGAGCARLNGRTRSRLGGETG